MLTQISSLNYLKTFVIAAQHLSFKAAANTLNISPTAVSHQIKGLESQLRVALFVRHTRAVSLTDAGNKLLIACLGAFSQLDATLNELQHDKRDLNISCCNSFAALWLTPRSAQISAAFPRNPLKICASDSLIDFSRDQHIDIALRYGPDQHNPSEQLLAIEQIGLYQSAQLIDNNPNHLPSALFVTQWANESVLKNITWQSHVDEPGYRVTAVEQEYFVLQAIMSGQGVGLLSDILAKTAVEQGWIVPVAGFTAFTGYRYWLRVNPARKEIGAVKQFSDWIKNEF
ncbi:LysR family transcriptional regulator [Motilimonas cestriensis]|uniref:LysR family transcriptional regulator n=1 Tax=Motilimonas cestriensis TaxID=2742685 RepID=A0ABS8W4C8_9GAMM|nr:LysR family transcriptional regulator [Motilimonas cestriensis]MCE2593368.1 LysR family transcriptional regulator [Motilimonas cestriensis]